MEGDPGFGRFYDDLSLFGMAMLSLVLASGMLQLFISWELVAWPLLSPQIGFWYEKFSAFSERPAKGRLSWSPASAI